MAGEGAGKRAGCLRECWAWCCRGGGFLGKEWGPAPSPTLPPAPRIFSALFPAPSPAIFRVSPFLYSVAGRLDRNPKTWRDGLRTWFWAPSEATQCVPRATSLHCHNITMWPLRAKSEPPPFCLRPFAIHWLARWSYLSPPYVSSFGRSREVYGRYDFPACFRICASTVELVTQSSTLLSFNGGRWFCAPCIDCEPITIGDTEISYLTFIPDEIFYVIACVSCVWRECLGKLILNHLTHN